MSRSRSTTPPAPTKAKKKSNRVEFSPISSSERRGSTPQGSLVAYHARLQSKESVERDKIRRLEIIARARARREAMLKRVRREKKFMLFSSIFAFMALFLWFAAVFTDHWFYVSRTEEMIDMALNKSSFSNIDKVFISSNTGLWKTCQNLQDVKSDLITVQCTYFSIFLTSREEATEGPNSHNEHVIDYTRAQICFAFISVLLMIMTIVAAFYTFKNSRYVYKRLASCLYFMTTISVLVVLEVLVTSVNYAEGAKLYPPNAIVTYGFSFYLGWSVFLVYLVNGCIFLILSRKRKYDKDEDDDPDGGLITGR